LTLTYQTNYPMLVGADTLQKAGITGKGVTIAVLDTGLWQDTLQNYGARVLATRDVTNGGTGAVSGDPTDTARTSPPSSPAAPRTSRRLSEHRAPGEPGHRARLQRYRRRPGTST